MFDPCGDHLIHIFDIFELFSIHRMENFMKLLTNG